VSGIMKEDVCLVAVTSIGRGNTYTVGCDLKSCILWFSILCSLQVLTCVVLQWQLVTGVRRSERPQESPVWEQEQKLLHGYSTNMSGDGKWLYRSLSLSFFPQLYIVTSLLELSIWGMVKSRSWCSLL